MAILKYLFRSSFQFSVYTAKSLNLVFLVLLCGDILQFGGQTFQFVKSLGSHSGVSEFSVLFFLHVRVFVRSRQPGFFFYIY
jgi:hypothetical protein